MNHLAIMTPSRHFIEKILSGQKTIESRWYKHKIAPWNRIKSGDMVYFKDSGRKVTARARVAAVAQFELNDLTEGLRIAKTYQKEICLSDLAIKDTSWLTGKNYVILVHLQNPEEVTPFSINKHGYGSACAWITVPNINAIAIK